jgi:hypothetical protein
VDNGGEFTSLLDTAGGAPDGRRASLGAGKKSASRKRNSSSACGSGSGSKKSRLKSAAVSSPTVASRQLRPRNPEATTTNSKSAAANQSLEQQPRSILTAAAAASRGTTTAAGEHKRSRQSLPRHQIDWSRALHLQQPAQHYALVLDQLFSNDSCLNSSCSEQLDGGNSCPGCGDSFLLPTTFFQHLYRRSVRIRFECRGCDGVKYLEFTNKCLFRLHLLSHLEQGGGEGLETGLLELSSLQPSEMMEINSNSNSSSSNSILSSLHRRTQSQLARSETEVQCMECLQVGFCL